MGGKQNDANTFAISPTLYSGLAALTLPRSWLENQKNPDRARLGAFGSFGFLVRRFLHHTGQLDVNIRYIPTGDSQFNSIPLGVNFSHSSTPKEKIVVHIRGFIPYKNRCTCLFSSSPPISPSPFLS